MNEAAKHIYEFEQFRLDEGKRLLFIGEGENVPLMPKAFDILVYLVRNAGKLIEKDELMSAIWPDTIVEENNLTQNISALRRELGEKHRENRFIATVPGRGYKFVADVRELSDPDPVTPEGTTIEPESKNAVDVGHEFLGGRRARRWLIAAGIVAAAALVFSPIYWRNEIAGPTPTPIRRIAVLPFKPLVAEDRNESMELGMADSLIAKLSSSENLIVPPLSAVRRFSALDDDSIGAGRALAVEAIVDGNIQISGDRIRISVKLLRVGDGKQLWSEQFDEKFTDIFTVQDSISERVAAALKIQLGGKDKKRYTENVEAYELYMKGRYHALNLTRAETDKGIAYFQQAIELDPNYALAYVGLSEVYLPMALTSDVPSWEVMPKAKAAALRAIAIDETLPEAHAALGFMIFWYDWDWQAAEKEYLRALELNPNSSKAHFGYAHLLSNIGRHSQALAEIKLARELDPVSLVNNAAEGQILFFAGRSDESLDRLNKTIDLNPNFWLSHLFISVVYTEKGMYAEAVASVKKAGELSGNSQSEAYRSYALAKWGKLDEARAVLDELLKLSNERYVPPYNFAVVYNGLGKSDKALDFLEKGFAEKNVLMVFLKVDPKWNNLRSEPRFIELMKRMNFE